MQCYSMGYLNATHLRKTPSTNAPQQPSNHLLNCLSSQPRFPSSNPPPPKALNSGNSDVGFDSFSRLLSRVSGLLDASSTASSGISACKNMPLLRLNQLPDFFSRRGGRSLHADAVVEAMLGEAGRLRLLIVDWLSWEVRGKLSEVRELLKEERRLLRLSSLRTPFRRGWSCCCCPLEVYGGCWFSDADAGYMGVRKLSGLGWYALVFEMLCFSGSGVGGRLVGTLSGVVGWDVSGPPPGVGGRMSSAGV